MPVLFYQSQVESPSIECRDSKKKCKRGKRKGESKKKQTNRMTVREENSSEGYTNDKNKGEIPGRKWKRCHYITLYHSSTSRSTIVFLTDKASWLFIRFSVLFFSELNMWVPRLRKQAVDPYDSLETYWYVRHRTTATRRQNVHVGERAWFRPFQNASSCPSRPHWRENAPTVQEGENTNFYKKKNKNKQEKRPSEKKSNRVKNEKERREEATLGTDRRDAHYRYRTVLQRSCIPGSER